MAKHLVLVGGGHAHLTCLKKLKHIVERGHRVTVISLADYHYYSGMGPGMLAGTYSPQEIRFNVKKMTESSGGKFVAGAVTRINAPKRLLYLASGEEIAFEVVSFNTGSSVPLGPLTRAGRRQCLHGKAHRKPAQGPADPPEPHKKWQASYPGGGRRAGGFGGRGQHLEADP